MSLYSIHPLPLPNGATSGSPEQVNDKQVIVGKCLIGNSYKPICWQSGTFNLVNLPTPSGGATGINSGNNVVGYYGSPFISGFVWKKNTGQFITLKHFPGQTNHTLASAINTYNQVTGNCVIGNLPPGIFAFAPVLWESETALPVNIGTNATSPIGTQPYCNDINNNKFIVGDVDFPGISDRHAFLWSPKTGVLNNIDGRAGWRSRAQAINDLSSPQVVGGFEASASWEFHAFIWDALFPQIVDLGMPGELSFAYDINNLGQVVGSAGKRAVMWEGLVRIDLNNPAISNAQANGWELIHASGINNKGAIVGYGYRNGDTDHILPWLLTPVKTISWLRRIPIIYMLPHQLWPGQAYDAPPPKGWPLGLRYPITSPSPFQLVGPAYDVLNNILIAKNVTEVTKSIKDSNIGKQIQKLTSGLIQKEIKKVEKLLLKAFLSGNRKVAKGKKVK